MATTTKQAKKHSVMAYCTGPRRFHRDNPRSHRTSRTRECTRPRPTCRQTARAYKLCCL